MGVKRKGKAGLWEMRLSDVCNASNAILDHGDLIYEMEHDGES